MGAIIMISLLENARSWITEQRNSEHLYKAWGKCIFQLPGEEEKGLKWSFHIRKSLDPQRRPLLHSKIINSKVAIILKASIYKMYMIIDLFEEKLGVIVWTFVPMDGKN